MKRIVAAVITLALLALAVVAGRQGLLPAAPAADSPQECIERMFAAAGRGDVTAYLACFTGPQLEELERQLADQPQGRFAADLVAAMGDLKGRAVVIEEPAERAAADRCRASVERVYTGRIDRQNYDLVCENGGWRIHAVTAATPQQPEKAYGTPVWQ